MFSLNKCLNLSRCLMVCRKQCLRLPSFCSTANTSAICRNYSDDKNDKFFKSEKYTVFKDDDSSIILDVEEERALLESQSTDDHQFDEVDEFVGFNTSRKYNNTKQLYNIKNI